MMDSRCKDRLVQPHHGIYHSRDIVKQWMTIGLIVLLSRMPMVQSTPMNTEEEKNRRSVLETQTSIKTRLQNALWKTHVSAPGEEESSVRRDELTRLIEQIRSVRLERPVDDDRPVETSRMSMEESKGLFRDPNQMSPIPVSQELGPDAGPISEPEHEDISEPQNRMEGLLDPNQALPDDCADPLYMADILYLGGHVEKALMYYQRAYQQLEIHPGLETTQSWILIQLARCSHKSDPENASKLYQQLINDYPGSDWAAMATTYLAISQWYVREQPQKLLEELSVKPPAQQAVTK